MKSSSAQANAENGAHGRLARLPNLTARMPPTFQHVKVHLEEKPCLTPPSLPALRTPHPRSLRPASVTHARGPVTASCELSTTCHL